MEVLASQMSTTSSGLDFEDTLLDGQKRRMEGSSAEIKDKNVAFIDNLLVETISNSSGCKAVDDREHIHTRHRSSILGSLSLGVVEVSWYGNGSIVEYCRDMTMISFTLRRILLGKQ